MRYVQYEKNYAGKLGYVSREVEEIKSMVRRMNGGTIEEYRKAIEECIRMFRDWKDTMESELNAPYRDDTQRLTEALVLGSFTYLLFIIKDKVEVDSISEQFSAASMSDGHDAHEADSADSFSSSSSAARSAHPQAHVNEGKKRRWAELDQMIDSLRDPVADSVERLVHERKRIRNRPLRP